MLSGLDTTKLFEMPNLKNLAKIYRLNRSICPWCVTKDRILAHDSRFLTEVDVSPESSSKLHLIDTAPVAVCVQFSKGQQCEGEPVVGARKHHISQQWWHGDASFILTVHTEIETGWVSEWFSLTGFLRTADIEVHIVHTSRVVIAYTLKSLSSLT